ncbi:MAG: Arm DNA-binding domain-containing protein [Deltaproteobacteria bacterium]|nr:Arm DNA-binding domain-containing protein [Deltaproteobacteria bacterium]
MTYSQILDAVPQKNRYRLFDGGGRSGLHLLVNPCGSKLWMVNYSFMGKRRVKSLGVFPAVGLQDARLKAAAFKTALREGSALTIEFTANPADRKQRR